MAAKKSYKNVSKKGTSYGKTFKTKKGKWGAYKYVSGRRVAFIPRGKK